MMYPFPKSSKSLSLLPALACMGELAKSGGNVDLTSEDFAFLTQDTLWLYTDQSRVRRVVEAACYGGLDVIGFPRFPLPAEFVAATIATFVAPANRLLACRIMEGTSSLTATLNGVDEAVNARQLFAHVCAITAEAFEQLWSAEHIARLRHPVDMEASQNE